jgi:hypothetical protein
MTHKIYKRSFTRQDKNKREPEHTHEDKINLEDNTLFEYVLELEQMEKLINNVGPEEEQKFGKMEAFDEGDDTGFTHLPLIIALIVLIVIIGFSLMVSGGCGVVMSSEDVAALSPNMGQTARAVFIR